MPVEGAQRGKGQLLFPVSNRACIPGGEFLRDMYIALNKSTRLHEDKQFEIKKNDQDYTLNPDFWAAEAQKDLNYKRSWALADLEECPPHKSK
jgi:hypothetical protein